jgi:hypothetical protein
LADEGLSKLSETTVETNEQAVALFERALGIDGAFAVAYLGLAKPMCSGSTNSALAANGWSPR